jgi:hypothetical protein
MESCFAQVCIESHGAKGHGVQFSEVEQVFVGALTIQRHWAGPPGAESQGRCISLGAHHQVGDRSQSNMYTFTLIGC